MNSYIEKLRSHNGRRDYRIESKLMQQKILGAMSAGDRVLDVGCGASGLYDDLWEAGVGVYGTDPGLELLQAHQRGLFVAGTAEGLPFPDQSFGAAYSMHSLAHFAKPELGLREIARVLKPDGKLIILTPNANFERVIGSMKKLLELVGLYHPDGTVVEHFTPTSLVELIAPYFGEITMSGCGLLGKQRILIEAWKR